jgi:hypothetical protein
MRSARRWAEPRDGPPPARYEDLGAALGAADVLGELGIELVHADGLLEVGEVVSRKRRVDQVAERSGSRRGAGVELVGLEPTTF